MAHECLLIALVFHLVVVVVAAAAVRRLICLQPAAAWAAGQFYRASSVSLLTVVVPYCSWRQGPLAILQLVPLPVQI